MTKKVGLVLTGGGARAAYQAGALSAISEILGNSESNPFSIYTGVSAGAINSSFLAAQAGELKDAVRELCNFWEGLEVSNVFRTDASSLSRIALGWIKDLSFGGMLKSSQSTYLLDFSPLRDFLGSKIDFSLIHKKAIEQQLHGVALSATNYTTGTSVTFYEGHESIDPWMRSSRIGLRADLTMDHLMASCAIPIFFSPIEIENVPYGDGGLRLTAPLSPAIHLGAEKVLAIGIRHPRTAESSFALHRESVKDHQIKLVDIAGTILNAIFMDSLDSDLERMDRINSTLKLLDPKIDHPRGLRPIPIYSILPSIDLGQLASELFDELPGILRYLLAGLGASRDNGWDLISYLAFDSTYTKRLTELGYKDTLAQKEELKAFFQDE